MEHILTLVERWGSLGAYGGWIAACGREDQFIFGKWLVFEFWRGDFSANYSEKQFMSSDRLDYFC
ncbi:MAG: hypothetical protein WBB23_18760 [Desulforhopalus sp.]